MNTGIKMTFMQACRDYFGVHEGQTSMQFGKEVQQLTAEDRAEISAGLEQQGYTIIAVMPTKIS